MEFPHVRYSCRAAIADMQFQQGSSTTRRDSLVNYVKELAFCTLDSNDIVNYHLKPPYSDAYLSDRAARQVAFVRDNINGLDWNDGCLSYEHLRETVVDLVEESNVSIIYVKGAEKRDILIDLLDSTPAWIVVYDIAEFGCPRLDQLPTYDSKCDAHRRSSVRCASHNVRRLIQWIKSNAKEEGAKYPQYEKRSRRLRSFQMFPMQIVQKARDLADEGFFYTGLWDRVICHRCGVSIDEWSATDRPRDRHLADSPNCEYLKALP